jgi:hypothetical protein
MRWATVILALSTVAACSLPRDPEGTTERIAKEHVLRVGVTNNPPWAEARGDTPAGIEPDLVRHFASSIGAKVVWRTGSETTLAQGLKHHELDLAVGGFDAQTPWVSITGVTQSFIETPDKKKHVMLTAPGENGFLLRVDRFLIEQRHDPKGIAP